MTKTVVVWLGALICCALWGSAFPCIKLGYEWMQIDAADTATQILYAGTRFTLAGVLVVIIGSFLQKKPLVPTKGAYPKIFVLCMWQTVIQYLFFYIGLAHTTGVKSSIIMGVNVFAAIIVAALIFHQEKITARKMLGCLVGFAGVVLVNITGSGIDTSFSIQGESFIIITAIAYAVSSACLKRYSKEYDTVMLSGYQFFVGGIILSVCGLLFGGRLTTFTGRAVLMLLWLSFVSAFAYSLWGILLKYNPVSKVAVFGFMNPVFGVLLSAILLKEGDSLGLKSAAALALVCIGIYIVNVQRKNA